MCKNAISALALTLCGLITSTGVYAERQLIQAIGLPLADHYAGIVAYEKYRDQMQYADFSIKLLKGPRLVRAYFHSEPDADIAFLLAPIAMDMFAEDPSFKWVSLLHRDGIALGINFQLGNRVDLPFNRQFRKPDSSIAEAIRAERLKRDQPVEVGVPSLLATHTVVLYKYLKDHGLTFSLNRFDDADVVLREIKPPLAPLYLKRNDMRAQPAAFQQSLPWAEVAEAEGHGMLGWYSKDVLQHPHGHIECLIIAKNTVIQNKREALQEVIRYIHLAGRDLEIARRSGGDAMNEIVEMVQRHIPNHSRESIIQSLRPDLNVINYSNLNIDTSAKASYRQIQDLALEAGLLEEGVPVYSIADDSFSSDVEYHEDSQ